MALTDQRYTVLQIINEVRRKNKLSPIATIDADSYGISLLNYLNDCVAEISDYGNWQETLQEVLVTAQSSVANYSLPSSVVVQNVHEVAYANRSAELRKISFDDIRRLQRLSSYGEPNQWAVKGVDANGNPIITVYPVPNSTQAGNTFNILYFQKPPFYTTAQATTIPPFPGRLLVQALHVKSVLDESDGEPTSRYQSEYAVYNEMLRETYNRYNGDTGSTVYFRPGNGRR